MYEIRKFKTFRGHDGADTAYECELWKDGKLLGHVVDDGWGGGCAFDISNYDMADLIAYCNTLPPEPMFGMKMDPELLMISLIEKKFK